MGLGINAGSSCMLAAQVINDCHLSPRLPACRECWSTSQSTTSPSAATSMRRCARCRWAVQPAVQPALPAVQPAGCRAVHAKAAGRRSSTHNAAVEHCGACCLVCPVPLSINPFWLPLCPLNCRAAPADHPAARLLRLLQAIQYVAEHGEVCPAGWKPGGKTMVADSEKSLEYFESVGDEEVSSGGTAWRGY